MGVEGSKNLLAIVYNNFGPYHLARLEAVAKLAVQYDFTISGIELASRETIYPWMTGNNRTAKKLTIFPEKSLEEIHYWDLAARTWTTLTKMNPQAIAIGPSKEAFAAYCTATFWARLRKRYIIIMMDSKYDDCPRNLYKEKLKKIYYSCFDAGLVGGKYSREYAEFLGLPPQRLFLGCDVVDNNYFELQTDLVRENGASYRKQYGLPENYFLYVGRFDEKKNISGLLQAFSSYLEKIPGNPWYLVLAGAGPVESQLRQEADALGLTQVIFAGFKQITELPVYYGLARCLIMPSLGDTWGLVVNEAMASGLPVLISKACGCAPDLVQEGVNGYTFNPLDIQGLTQLMLKMSSGALDLKAMGEASKEIISHWTLDTFAQNLFAAVESARRLKF